MYSTYNEGKPVVAERFIRTLKNKIFEHMTAISKNVYSDVLDDIKDTLQIGKKKILLLVKLKIQFHGHM